MGARLSLLGTAALAHQRLHHRRIGERRGVAQLIGRVLGDLAQDAAHDLARSASSAAPAPTAGGRAWRSGRFRWRTCAISSWRNASLGVSPGDQGHVGVDALALEVVREADHRGFGDLRMRDQRALDFRGAEAMAADVDDVVDAAGDPVVAVGIAAAAVAGEIHAGIGLEIGVDEALVVAVHRAHLPGPRIEQHQVAFGLAFEQSRRSASTSAGCTPKNGLRRRARLGVGHARQRRDHDAAGFGLPPGVDDRAAARRRRRRDTSARLPD